MIKSSLILIAFLSILSCQNSQDNIDKVKSSDSELIAKLSKENSDLSSGVFNKVENVKAYRRLQKEIEQQLIEIDDKSSTVIKLARNKSDNIELEDDIMLHLKHINTSLHNIRLKSNSLYESHKAFISNGIMHQDSVKVLRKELHQSINKVLDKEKEIDKMHEQIALEGESYKDLYEEYQKQKSYSEVLYSIIHTKFYFIGTKDELLEKSIVENIDAEILIPNADANNVLFTSIIVEKQNFIKLNSNKVNLISAHPKDSYELVGDNTITGLNIIDYRLFWDKTDFLIIEVE